MKRICTILLTTILAIALAACAAVGADTSTSGTGQEVASSSESGTGSVDASEPVTVEYDSEDLEVTTGETAQAQIRLEGDSIRVDGTGVTVAGTTATVTAAGTYLLTGSLQDGQVRVDVEGEGQVVLVLDGASISCSTSAPLYIVNAGKTIITLAEGSVNALTDGETYLLEDPDSNEPNAALFSNDDLTINGSGSLVVQANYNNGIASDDNLKITGGTLTVNAVNDGLKGRNYLAIRDGNITVVAGGDGLRSDNAEDATRGYISIEGGILDITAGLDGIQAETRLAVSGGELTVSSGGGSANSSSLSTWGNWGLGADPFGSTQQETDTTSAKGLKAGVEVVISGGSVTIDSSDDAVHSNGSIVLSNGTLQIASGDDGMHADATLTISGGEVNITRSYEGIESEVITIAGGTIHVTANDDGLNGSGGADGSSLGGRPGQNDFTVSGNTSLAISGGTLTVDALGDGIDVNGPITMTAGLVIVNGPTENMNGAMDYLGSFTLSGGTLVAVGSAGMAQAPGETSTQYSILYNFPSMLAAGTMVHIESQDGTQVLTFVPTKAFQSVVVSTAGIAPGDTLVIYTGGSSTGTAVDGLYTGGTYSGGSEVASLAISGMVTSNGGMGGGMMPGGGGPRP